MRTTDPKTQRIMRDAALLIGAFLLGLLPMLIQNFKLKRKLARTDSALALSETRDIACLAYLEASRNNSGLAAKHTSTLYDRLGEVAKSGTEPGRSIARDALARRDAVMGLLATADPTARNELQDLTDRLLAAGRTETETRAKRIAS